VEMPDLAVIEISSMIRRNQAHFWLWYIVWQHYHHILTPDHTANVSL